jgi:hypothetical protein
MHLRTLQFLLVFGAFAWALFPVWGGAAYTAALLLVAVSVWFKSRAARRVLDGQREALEKTLRPEVLVWVRRFAFFYVWPDESKAWATTLKMSSLLMLLETVAIVVRTVLEFSLTPLWQLVPAALSFFFGAGLGGRLEVDALVNEDAWKVHQPLHAEASRVLRLQKTGGLAPPPAA